MPRRARRPPTPAADALANRLALRIGAAFAEERRRRRLTSRQVADRARVSAATVNSLEAGRRLSLDAYARVAVALGMPLDWAFGSSRRSVRRSSDLVHAAMGEFETRLLSRHTFETAIDHPYQHYQFAGRADVLAWTREPAALLHIENRTRFPDFQEMAGSYNAKRRYLAGVVAKQLGLGRFQVETHVIAALWSAEVISALRATPSSFHALCPDKPDPFVSWLRGEVPQAEQASTLVLLDPLARGRQRAFVGLADALGGTRPRVRGYADAADRLRDALSHR